MTVQEVARLEAVVGGSVESLSLALTNQRRKSGASREARRIFRRDALVLAAQPSGSVNGAPDVRARIVGSLAVDRTVTWHCAFLPGGDRAIAPDLPFAVKAVLFQRLADVL
jgi:hypothetical protein